MLKTVLKISSALILLSVIIIYAYININTLPDSIGGVGTSLAWDEAKKTSEGKLILIDKRNNTIVPDLQDHAKSGILMDNAIRQGKGIAENFEEVRVSESDYKNYVNVFIEQSRVEREAQETAKQVEIDVAKANITNTLKITNEQVESICNEYKQAKI